MIKTTKDKEQFSTGAHRNSQAGKPRYDLIPAEALERVAQHFGDGAEIHGPDNWKKGITNDRFMASTMRHIESYRLGRKDEDHLAAAVWNLMCIMWNENQSELDSYTIVDGSTFNKKEDIKIHGSSLRWGNK